MDSLPEGTREVGVDAALTKGAMNVPATDARIRADATGGVGSGVRGQPSLGDDATRDIFHRTLKP